MSRMNKNRNCRLAYELFLYCIIKNIGSYIAALGGLDNLVFTAKIGENVPKLRDDICSHFSFLGIRIDKEKNKKNSGVISAKNSRIKIFVKKDNEEKMIVEKVLKIL